MVYLPHAVLAWAKQNKKVSQDTFSHVTADRAVALGAEGIMPARDGQFGYEACWPSRYWL